MPPWFEPMAATLTQDRFSGRRLAVRAQVRRHSAARLQEAAPTSSCSRATACRNTCRRWPRPSPVFLSRDVDSRRRGDLGRPKRVSRVRHPVAERTSRDLAADRRAACAARRSCPSQPPMQRVELLDDENPWERASREGWEGVIAKRRGSPYEHRRSKHWLKMKCEASQELVVGGFTDPQGARVGLGALLVGHYEGSDFVFAGKIGTGFDTKLLLDLRKRLDAIELPASPFTKATGLPQIRAHWVRPEIVVQVAFIEWTAHGKLRHPRLLGVRFDKTHATSHGHRCARRTAVITHPEKVLFPDDGITKGDLAAYYEAMAPVILPHLRGRPITMERYPAGIGKKGFWQKDVSKGFPGLAAARRGAEEGRRRPSSGHHRHAIAAVDHQPEHDHPARLDVADPRPLLPRSLRVRSRSVERRPGRAVRAAAIGLRDLLEKLDAAVVGQDHRLEGLPHRRPARRQDRDGARRAVLPHAVGSLFVSRAPDRLTQEFARPIAAGGSMSTPAETVTAPRLRRRTPCARSAGRRCLRRARGKKSNGGKVAPGDVHAAKYAGA